MAVAVKTEKPGLSCELLNGSPSTSSQHLQDERYSPKITGIPCVAAASRYTAPVHIDIGGTLYTSSLETLTRYPESRLARFFNGSIPIVLDSLKQHYFLDRDGKMFRYILSYLRTGQLLLPDNFRYFHMLYEEAKYYDIGPMICDLEEYKRNNFTKPKAVAHGENADYECISMHVSPDLGERITLSGDRNTIEELFPETGQSLMDGRNTGWNQDPYYVIRFPINGYCKLNSIQVFQRLFNGGFKIVASTGGGVEGQQFCEYLLCKQLVPS